MRIVEKIAGVGTALMVWRKVRVGLEHPSTAWFGERFLEAATVVVDRWGPRWARKRLVTTAPIGAWILVVAWLGVPLWLVRVWFLRR